MTLNNTKRELEKVINEINILLESYDLSSKDRDFLVERLNKSKQDLKIVNNFIYETTKAKHGTLEYIGNKMGVTRERIRQIEKDAIKKLQHKKFNSKLRKYLDITETQPIEW